jgi:hypothetical protein
MHLVASSSSCSNVARRQPSTSRRSDEKALGGAVLGTAVDFAEDCRARANGFYESDTRLYHSIAVHASVRRNGDCSLHGQGELDAVSKASQGSSMCPLDFQWVF